MNIKKIPSEFTPPIYHPSYFIRHEILNGILRNKDQISGKLLDFGCGAMPYKSLFNVDEYIGVDYEGEGHSHKNENVDVFYDGKNIPFENNYFDAIFCSEVFEHLFEMDLILIELNRVLKPGGKILISTPFVWNLHEIPVDFARYTPFGLKHMLEKSGFEIKISEQNGGYITVIFQIITLYILQLFKYNSKKLFLSTTVRLFKYGLIFITNGIGILLCKILPNRDDLYLSNLIVAIKS